MEILEISKKFQRNFGEISSNTIMNVYISILTLGLKYMKVLDTSKKFHGNEIKHNNECIHIHPNHRPEIYRNFRNFKEIKEKFRINFREISSNTIMNVYIPILILSLKYMNAFGISKKFQGNFMKHKNEYSQIHHNPRPEEYENFGNFKEISEKFRVDFRKISSNTIMNAYISILILSLKYMKGFGISKKFQGYFIKHKNECSHVHPNPRPEVFENFGNFKEISEKFECNFGEI